MRGIAGVAGFHSDDEVVVHGYAEWGEDCIEHLESTFALDRCRESGLISCGDVLEHLMEPGAFMRFIRNHLSPEGLMSCRRRPRRVGMRRTVAWR